MKKGHSEKQRAHEIADLTLKLHARANNAKLMHKQCGRLTTLLDAITEKAEEEAELERERAQDIGVDPGEERVGQIEDMEQPPERDRYFPGSPAEMEALEDELFALVPPDDGEISTQDSADYSQRPPSPSSHNVILAAILDRALIEINKMRKSIGTVVKVIKARSMGLTMRVHKGVRHCRRMRYYRTHIASLLNRARQQVKKLADSGYYEGSAFKETTSLLRKTILDLEHELEKYHNPATFARSPTVVDITGGMSYEDFAALDKLSWKLEQCLENRASYAGVDSDMLLRVIKEQRKLLAEKRM